MSSSSMVRPRSVSLLLKGDSTWCLGVAHALPVIGVATFAALGTRGQATSRAFVGQATCATGPQRGASVV